MTLPPDIEYDPDNPPDELPELPPGFVWGLKVTAGGEVVRPPGADECWQIHPGEPCPGYPHKE